MTLNTSEIGLLPHEKFYAELSYAQQAVKVQEAGQSIGAALDNKPSGDWGGDDTGIQAAQDEYHIQKTLKRDLEGLTGLDVLAYPEPEYPMVTYGTHFRMQDEYGADDYALGTRPFIDGMPIPLNMILVSPEAPMGQAVMGLELGSVATWLANGRTLTGTITLVDQTTIPEFYTEAMSQLLPQQS